MSEVIIGVDPSSKKLATVATMDGTNPRCNTRPLPGNRNIAVRCFLAEAWICTHVKRYRLNGHTVHVFIEDPALGIGGAHATIIQARVNGALMAGALRGGAETVMGVNNQRFKKAVIGKGNATKGEISQWVHDHWRAVSDMAGNDQDLKDAAAICKYGIDTMARLKRQELEG